MFEIEEPPSANNITAKFCELCDGATDHNTWECKKVDNSNYSESERRKINQCRIKYYEKIQTRKKKAGMPITKKPSATPPRDRPPLPLKEIMTHELPTPKVTAISEEQKEAFKNSDLTDKELSAQDPLQGTLAFDENAENLDILENLIKDKAGVDDEEVRTPYPKFNEPFVARNSVDKEQDIYVPIDADSEEDFDQEDFNAYGHADPSLKNY